MYKLFMIFLSIFSATAYAHGGHSPLSGLGHVLLHFEYMLPAAFVAIIIIFCIYKMMKAK